MEVKICCSSLVKGELLMSSSSKIWVKASASLLKVGWLPSRDWKWLSQWSLLCSGEFPFSLIKGWSFQSPFFFKNTKSTTVLYTSNYIEWEPDLLPEDFRSMKHRKLVLIFSRFYVKLNKSILYFAKQERCSCSQHLRCWKYNFRFFVPGSKLYPFTAFLLRGVSRRRIICLIRKKVRLRNWKSRELNS